MLLFCFHCFIQSLLFGYVNTFMLPLALFVFLLHLRKVYFLFTWKIFFVLSFNIDALNKKKKHHFYVFLSIFFNNSNCKLTFISFYNCPLASIISTEWSNISSSLTLVMTFFSSIVVVLYMANLNNLFFLLFTVAIMCQDVTFFLLFFCFRFLVTLDSKHWKVLAPFFSNIITPLFSLNFHYGNTMTDKFNLII